MGDQVLDPELGVAREGVGHLVARPSDRALRRVRARVLEGDRDPRRQGQAGGIAPGFVERAADVRQARAEVVGSLREAVPRAVPLVGVLRHEAEHPRLLAGDQDRRAAGADRGEAAARRPRRGGIGPRSSLAHRGGAARGSRDPPRSGRRGGRTGSRRRRTRARCHPQPRPRIRRPLLTSSSSAAIFAVSAGLRNGSASTSGPISTRVVIAATAVRTVHDSWMPVVVAIRRER